MKDVFKRSAVLNNKLDIINGGNLKVNHEFGDKKIAQGSSSIFKSDSSFIDEPS